MSNNSEIAKKIFFEAVDLLKKNDLQNSENKFLEALKYTPGRISIISNLIQIYILSKDQKKLENILLLNKKIKDTFEYNIGYAYLLFYQSNFTDSLRICETLNSNEYSQIIQLENLKIKNHQALENFEKVIELYNKIILTYKDDFINYFHFGNFFIRVNELEKAIECFNKALILSPKNPKILWHISFCELKLGNYTKGYSLYEHKPQEKKYLKFQSIPKIKSESELYKSKVLIWGDQGYGDMIQFSRFAKYASESNKNLTLALPKIFKDLFKNLSNDLKIIDFDEVNKNEYQLQIALSNLPNFLPFKKFNEVPYYPLEINDEKNIDIDIPQDKLNIGLCWSGRSYFNYETHRNIPLSKFSNILNSKKFMFFKLQKDLRDKDVELLKLSNNIVDLGNKSFSELPKYMKKFDLIVSSDTSIVHLASILNLKTILLLNYNSDWRWFLDKHKSIWYPSLKIMKQEKFDNWNNVLSSLEKELLKIYSLKFNN